MASLFPEFEQEAPARYPTVAGWKKRATSKAAAEAITPKAGSLRERILAALRDGPRTPEELAPTVGATVHSTRSRCSELCADKLITDSGLTGPSLGQKEAIKWRLAR